MTGVNTVRRRVEQGGENCSTEIFVSNVTTLAGNFTYATAFWGRGKYESDKSRDDEEAVDVRYGTDRRMVVMGSGMNGSTDDGRDANISIKGDGDGRSSATPRGEVHRNKERNSIRRPLRWKPSKEVVDYYKFIAENEEHI